MCMNCYDEYKDQIKLLKKQLKDERALLRVKRRKYKDKKEELKEKIQSLSVQVESLTQRDASHLEWQKAIKDVVNSYQSPLEGRLIFESQYGSQDTWRIICNRIKDFIQIMKHNDNRNA